MKKSPKRKSPTRKSPTRKQGLLLMSQPVALTIHIDGAARGNPGPAAYAFIMNRDKGPAIVEKGLLGTATNNLAEYTALVKALERAAREGAERLVVHSDSELLVKQMNGQYRVKNPDLRVLYEKAKELGKHFKEVVFRHVARENNRETDRLCNEALDEALPRSDKPPTAHRPNNSRIQAAREQAIQCLQSVAASWAKGDASKPSPEAVWEQLWSILEENEVIRRAK
jgi:ribonuclease HI